MRPWSRWLVIIFFSSRRRHTRLQGDWSSDVCSSDLGFPLNSFDNGGLPTAWNGKVGNIGGGGLEGGLGAGTTAPDAGYAGSNTGTRHPTPDNPDFPGIQATQELNYGTRGGFLRANIPQQ